MTMGNRISIERIDKQIDALDKLLKMRLASMHSYEDASIDEKIACRVLQAEIEALKELKFGADLEKMLNWCIENEQYSGAEGLRRVLAKKENYTTY